MTAATIKASVAISETGSNAFSSGPFWNGAMEYLQVLSDGTTANKADLSYMAERTVAASTNDDIDLAGSLTDALGATVTAAELVMLIIINRQKDGTANTTDLTIDGTVTNGMDGFLNAAGIIGPIKPGGMIMLSAGDAAGLGAVTAGTGDLLRVSNDAGGSNTYQVAILARSA